MMWWLLACEPEPEPGPCPPEPTFWEPLHETLHIVDEDASFLPSEGTVLRDDGQVGFVGAGTLVADVVATRGATYSGSLAVQTAGTATLTVEWLQDSGNVETMGTFDLATPAPLVLEPHSPGRVMRFTITGDTDLALTNFDLAYDEWAAVEDTGSGVLSLGFLIHIEQHNSYDNDETVWWRRARVAQALIETFTAHGVRPTLQPDASFVKGTRVWDPEWFGRMAALGAGFAGHLHDEEGTETDLEAAVREAKRAFADVEVEVHDINGGFQLAIWDRFAAAGFRTLSAYKDPTTQSGPPRVSVLPWRPPDGAGTADIDAFLSHDPAGSMVYLGGGLDREAAHDRVATVGGRRLSQLLAHTVEGETNTGYFVTHVDLFGPPGDDKPAQDAYLDSPAFQADLAYYDAWLGTELDPLVQSGRIEWLTLDEMSSPWLKKEEECQR